MAVPDLVLLAALPVDPEEPDEPERELDPEAPAAEVLDAE